MSASRISFVCVAAFLLVFTLPDFSAGRQSGWVPMPREGEAYSPPAETAPRKTRDKGTQKVKKPDQAGAQKIVGKTVYDKQPPVTENELCLFMELLPKFRTWARRNNEEAHPIVGIEGKPDFLYSDKAARWVREHDFDPARFFCVMGRMAAALVIVEEGNDFKGTRPKDMPEVSDKELSLARKHLGSLLTAGGPPQPIN